MFNKTAYLSTIKSHRQNIMYIVRKSDHIYSDLLRNWSSWNFGQEGLNVSMDVLEDFIDNMSDDDILSISGFELTKQECQDSTFGELYPGYVVLIDDNQPGLCANLLNATSLEDAIAFVSAEGFNVDLAVHESYDCSNAKVVYSKDDIHIIQL